MTLRDARKLKCFTQSDLADMVQVSHVTISLIERNKVVPTQKTRQRLEKVLYPVRIDWHTTVPVERVYDLVKTYVGKSPIRAMALKEFINKWMEVNSLDILNTKQR